MVGIHLPDQFQRRITYLRLSVTDRCDLRCSYCMPERQTFLPRAEVLSLEELHEMALGFVARGITKIRLDDDMFAWRAFSKAIELDPAHTASYEELGLLAMQQHLESHLAA